MSIAPEIQTKLDKSITELLMARLNTHQVRDLLAKQQSFGKYDGCTPAAILERANAVCKEINAKEDRDLKDAILASPTARMLFNVKRF